MSRADKETSEEAEILVEEREETMISITGGKARLRRARFLKPCTTDISQAIQVPSDQSLLSDYISSKLVKWPSKVLFKGWRNPQKKWKQWVHHLLPTHKPTWKKLGIYDSIMASTCRIIRNDQLVLAFAQFWCPETSTFIFPWGEATLTLEDMLVLGGFPVLGEDMNSLVITQDLVEIEEKMKEEHNGFRKLKAKKVSHAEWIKRFMCSEDELEHIAFLSLWLSRFVFPIHPCDTLHKSVFPIAIHLSRGTWIALAQPLLASLYRDLGSLKGQVLAAHHKSLKMKNGEDEVGDSYPVLWAPLQLLQMWIWERFPTLRPNPNPLEFQYEPRSARWHNVKSKLDFESVRSSMNSVENFQWRPYTTHVKGWTFPSFYREKGEWVSDDRNLDIELRSFGICLQPCELVGQEFRLKFWFWEKYLPHRVAMQFGMDQDLPGQVTEANNSCNKVIQRSTKFYVPPRLFEPNVTVRYLEWWKQSMMIRQDTIKCVLAQTQTSSLSHYRLQQDSNCQELRDSSDEDELALSQAYRIRKKQSTCPELIDSSHEEELTFSQAFRINKQQGIPESVKIKTADKAGKVDLPNLAIGTERSAKGEESKGGDTVKDPIGIDDYEREIRNSSLHVPGMELETRICKLERVIAWLKSRAGPMAERKCSQEGPSHT